MAFATAIHRQLSNCWSGLRRRIYRFRATCVAKLSGGDLKWPPSVVAAVPVRVDGSGRVALEKGVHLGYRPAPRLGSGEILLQARVEDSAISIGARTLTSSNLTICAMESVRIGRGCQIGDQVSIYDCDFHEIEPSTRLESPGEIAPVSIGDNVWLGSRVMVLRGVTIGDNTVVAAGSIVTKPLPQNVVAAGIPAKVVRQIGE